MLKLTVRCRRWTAGETRAVAGRFHAAQLSRQQVNRGELSRTEIGSQFTDPVVYRNRFNLNRVLAATAHETKYLREQHRSRTVVGQVSTATEHGLDRGAEPTSRTEESINTMIDNAELRLSTPKDPRADALRYDTRTHMTQIKQAMSREYREDKFADKPNAATYTKYFRMLRGLNKDDEAVTARQQRLIDENGVYPSQRIDAYMLDDESHFPPWVQQLPWGIRDRVKYGGLGLTEADEATRIRLARLPKDEREREWKRLKGAREYEEGKEIRLTPAELRDVRRAKRRHFYLYRKRQHRASLLRRLALRKPERFEAWPSNVVDYSKRMALIAQYVENKVETKGHWPLCKETVARAKLLRKREEAERAFIHDKDENRLLNHKASSAAPGLSDLLQSLDQNETPVKRLSRKAYANRVNAVVHGDQDVYGRNYYRLSKQIKQRPGGISSSIQADLEQEIRREPRVYAKGRPENAMERWSVDHKRHVFHRGMPSMRYAS